MWWGARVSLPPSFRVTCILLLGFLDHHPLPPLCPQGSNLGGFSVHQGWGLLAIIFLECNLVCLGVNHIDSPSLYSPIAPPLMLMASKLPPHKQPQLTSSSFPFASAGELEARNLVRVTLTHFHRGDYVQLSTLSPRQRKNSQETFIKKL